MTTRTNVLGFLSVLLLFAAMFAPLFGALGTTAPERECGACGRWGRWWGERCPHCGAR